LLEQGAKKASILIIRGRRNKSPKGSEYLRKLRRDNTVVAGAGEPRRPYILHLGRTEKGAQF
jgi:hypothetical protein